MTKPFKVLRCLRLAENAQGRDLVVGDLHGHRNLFERELERLSFDPSRDRVLSVGDLIDRGPECLATLSLIEQPWFHAVLGNHELMLLNYLGYYGSRLHSRKSYAFGAGEWINAALAKHRKTIHRLADRVAALPLAIHVEADVPFNVAHGDLHPIGSRQDVLLSEARICVHKADASTTSRSNIADALRSELLELSFDQHPVQLSPSPMGELPITYVGHSPMRHITVHESYVYIDQGVSAATPRRAGATPPTVLDHRRFSYWLHGVAAACGQGTAVPPRLPPGVAAHRPAAAPV